MLQLSPQIFHIAELAGWKIALIVVGVFVLLLVFAIFVAYKVWRKLKGGWFPMMESTLTTQPPDVEEPLTPGNPETLNAEDGPPVFTAPGPSPTTFRK